VVYFGSNDWYLYAVDTKTGEEKWKFETGRAVSSPALSDGMVYFGSDDKHVYAVDSKTGEEKWKFEAGGSVRSSPNVVDMKIDELFKRLVVAIRNDTSADYSDALDLSDEEFMSDIEKYCTLTVGIFIAEEIEKKIYKGLFNLQNWYQNEWLVDGETPLYESGLSGFKEDWRLNEINTDWNATVYNLVNDTDPNSILDYY